MQRCHRAAVLLTAVLLTLGAALLESGVARGQERETDPGRNAAGAESGAISPRSSSGQSGAAQQANRKGSAQELVNAVEEEIYHDPFISLDDVDVVRTGEGFITLKGSVRSLLAKDRAERVAETVRGVRSVDNQLLVQPRASPTGQELESAIIQALLANAATESFDVRVQGGPGGEVMLTGEVDSWAERSLSERLAKSVTGVREVTNNLEVSYSSSRTDRDIAADIESMLRWDAYTHEQSIDVKVRDAIVTLSGAVPSAAEKRRATTIARVNGVNRVDASKLSVDPSLIEGRSRTAAAQPDNDELERAVRRKLQETAHVSVRQLDVSVESGVATLRGVVISLEEKRVANTAVQSVNGVLRVRDRLRVRDVDDALSDEEIEKRVTSALALNPVTEAYKITAAVDDGVAMLSGHVKSPYVRSVADDLAAGVRGVREVENALQATDRSRELVFDPYVDARSVEDYPWVDPPASASVFDDEFTLDAVRRELTWSPYVDEDAVKLSVEGGVVTLRGSVDSKAAVRAATENAFEGGALAVVNELTVAAE